MLNMYHFNLPGNPAGQIFEVGPKVLNKSAEAGRLFFLHILDLEPVQVYAYPSGLATGIKYTSKFLNIPEPFSSTNLSSV